jgi:hypothetical protein
MQKKAPEMSIAYLAVLWEAHRIKKKVRKPKWLKTEYVSRIFFMNTVGSLVISKEAEG